MGILRSRSSRRRSIEQDGDRLLIALVNEARTPDELRNVVSRAARGSALKSTRAAALRRRPSSKAPLR